jgi:uncharacterized spore protein YtfJ
MAEGNERRTAERRTAPRRKSEVVPTGDPEHEKPVAAESEPRGPLAFLEQARDVMTVRRVFGDPIERDGVTVIPAAKVRGGGGGGFGEGPQAQGRGGGGGFGVAASPAGVYIIREGRVTWRPALDLNRTIFMGQLVGIVFLLTLRSIVKALAKRR